MFMGKCW